MLSDKEVNMIGDRFLFLKKSRVLNEPFSRYIGHENRMKNYRKEKVLENIFNRKFSPSKKPVNMLRFRTSIELCIGK